MVVTELKVTGFFYIYKDIILCGSSLFSSKEIILRIHNLKLWFDL